MSSINTDVVNILLFVNNGNDRDENMHYIVVHIVLDYMIRAWVPVVYNVIIGIVNDRAPGSSFADVPVGVPLDCLLPRRREDGDRQRRPGLCQRRRQGGKLLLSWWPAPGLRTQ